MQNQILETHKETEKIMLLRLLSAAQEFYEDPKNQQAYEAWLKNKEADKHAANYVNA